MIDAKMTLDVQKNGVQKTVYIKEGETAGARRIIITLTNNGKVVGVVGKTVFCYIKRPTATNLVTDATHVDDDTNTIIFDVPSLSEGTYYLELVVQDASANQIYSPTFCIIAEDALYTSASGSFSPNTAYIVVTDDNFYTETEVDDLLLDKQDVLTAGDNITIDDGVISADATNALIIELTGTETAGTYTTAVTFAEVDEAATTGSPMLIKYSEVVGGNTLTRYKEVCGFRLGYNMGLERYKYDLYVFNGTGYTAFTFKTSGSGSLPTVKSADSTFLPTIDNAPTQNSSNLVKSGGVYTAINTAVSGKEDAINKVTSISESSTDTQYPSAKCVYDAIQGSGLKVRYVNSLPGVGVSNTLYITEEGTGVYGLYMYITPDWIKITTTTVEPGGNE